jgi:hypothetical protein
MPAPNLKHGAHNETSSLPRLLAIAIAAFCVVSATVAYSLSSREQEPVARATIAVAKVAEPAHKISVAQESAAATPTRGDSAATYEGVWAKDGNFLFEDCSQFEIRVAKAYMDEVFRLHGEPEARITLRAAQKVGLPKKLASDIYTKATARCLRAISGGP